MKLTTEFLASKAIKDETRACLWEKHPGCTIRTFTCAVQTPGGVSHRMTYDEHSIAPGGFYAAARPYCGSRRTLGQHTGAFVATVTCKKC